MCVCVYIYIFCVCTSVRAPVLAVFGYNPNLSLLAHADFVMNAKKGKATKKERRRKIELFD